jgi:hypothetical protein
MAESLVQDHVSEPTEGTMNALAKGLTALAMLAFLLAVVTKLTGPFLVLHAAGFSRTCADLALLAIAVVVVFEGRPFPGAAGPRP